MTTSAEMPETTDTLDRLPTELPQPGLEDLDTRSAGDLVDLLLAAESRVPDLLAQARAEIAEAVEEVVRAMRAGGRLIYVGAGTPGRLAQLDALECVPTFGVDVGRVIAVMAGGPQADNGSFEEGEDDAAAARADLAARDLTSADVVVGITASGRTPYVIEALRFARVRSATAIAVTNNVATPVAAIANIAVEVPTGPEVLGGSTRLTAGTAQKIVLNTLSTAAMIRSGRSFGGWMVDVQPSNEKLRRRAQQMVATITGAPAAQVSAALEAAEQHAGTAVVALLAQVDVARARQQLDDSEGSVRAALTALGASGRRLDEPADI